MNRKMKIMICLGLVGGSFLFFIISCSTVLSPGETKIAGFVSNVRPARGNPDSHYLLAGYYQERGRHKEAIEEFRKLLSIDRRYVKAYNGIGVSSDMLGDFPTAVTYYKMALNLDPNLDYLHNNLGYSYLLQGNLDEAILAFQKAVSLNDKENRFHNNLGLAYAEKGEFDLALAQFKKAGDEAKAHYNMAQVYFKKGLYHEAKDYYATALKLNPSLTIVQTGLDAANALARIFEPENKKPATRSLVMPDQPVIKEEEAIKIAAALRSPSNYPDAQQTIAEIPPEGQIEAGNLMEETPLIRREATIVRIEDPKQSEHPKSSESATVKSQPPARNGNEVRVEEILSLKKVGIEISNGNGAHRMAKKVGDYLKERGLKVTRLTNANHFRHTETRIFYQKDYDEAAEHVTEHLPVFQSKEETEKFDRPNIKIKIVIGKDMVPHLKTFENGKKA